MLATESHETRIEAAPFEPLALAHGPRWANRLALAPLTNLQSNPDGTLSDDEYDWLLARSGFGITMTCATSVSSDGKAWDGQLEISDDRHLPGLTRLADGIRAAGGVSSVQLHHAGRRADPEVNGEPRKAPWAEPDNGTRALTTSEIRRIIEDFVSAAALAETAGFDGIEVHGAHSYLVCQFLDGDRNLRADGYGGSLEDRSRMLVEILNGIRESTGPDFQVGLRLSPERFGVTLPEARAVAQWVLDDELVDYLDMSLHDIYKTPEDRSANGLLIDAFTSLERGDTRLGVTGRILSATDAEWCLQRGADFVCVGTAAIIQHDFPAKIKVDPRYVSAPLPVTREHATRWSARRSSTTSVADGRTSCTERASQSSPPDQTRPAREP